jgi:hypothetical protein
MPSQRIVSAELELLLSQYMRLRIDSLRRESEEAVARQRREADAARRAATRAAVERELGSTVSRLLALATYGLLLGVFGSPALIASIADPKALADHFQTTTQALSEAVTALPGVPGTIIGGAVTALVVLAFQSTSVSLRSDLAGTIVGAIAVLAALGFAAAITSGPFWAVAGLFGLVGSAYVLYRFFDMLEGLVAVVGGVADEPRRGPSLLVRATLAARTLTAWFTPANRWLRFTFLSCGVFSIVLVTVTTAVWELGHDHAGYVYWSSWAGQRVFVGWTLWAFLVTPRAVRIALWSQVGWAALVLALLLLTPVSAVFALAVAAMVLVNVTVLVLRSRPPVEEWAHRLRG